MKAVCVIPSRYAASRLPGKPLIDLCGKPLIQRVYEQAVQAKNFDRVIVATDDERIFSTVHSFGGEVVMSPPELPCGTDRVARVLDDLHLDHEIIMNLQGDEPMIDPEDLDRLVQLFLDDATIEMASLMAPLDDEDGVKDPNQVKAIADLMGYALYFSRHPIPYWRKREESDWKDRPAAYWLHLGVYVFTRNTIRQYAVWPRSSLEISEGLEQLRALENGVRIKMLTTPHPWPGVNTPEDVERVRKAIEKSNTGKS